MNLTEAINSRHSVRQFTVQWANRWRKLRRHIMRKI